MQKIKQKINDSDLAEKFGLSFQRITAIVYKEQDKIFRHFE